jgi:hypothetical protein
LICECSLSLCLSVSPSLSVSLLLSDLQCVCLFPLKSFFICVSLFILGPWPFLWASCAEFGSSSCLNFRVGYFFRVRVRAFHLCAIQVRQEVEVNTCLWLSSDANSSRWCEILDVIIIVMVGKALWTVCPQRLGRSLAQYIDTKPRLLILTNWAMICTWTSSWFGAWASRNLWLVLCIAIVCVHPVVDSEC